MIFFVKRNRKMQPTGYSKKKAQNDRSLRLSWMKSRDQITHNIADRRYKKEKVKIEVLFLLVTI